ncbi:hypothetical protein PSCI_3105 [Pseudomonas sp. StFLB209]|uniref:hypothetical protein n=1 Tax=Pseudomonas sp. StFLB209 TaxID=1028989 RepID=UPI0004F7C386|nr:hypothetical protein [Pseudomonas sp. StFLB209]BAP43807.1 hypothetical protein PSCI_3105 [Pseudomonas sp. StFLB209]
MNRICCVVLAMLPTAALAYPIEVQKSTPGVQVDYRSHDTYHDTGSLTLDNYGQVDARCRVEFINGPEAPRVRRVEVKAGQSLNVVSKFNRSIIKLRVKLECEPAA